MKKFTGEELASKVFLYLMIIVVNSNGGVLAKIMVRIYCYIFLFDIYISEKYKKKTTVQLAHFVSKKISLHRHLSTLVDIFSQCRKPPNINSLMKQMEASNLKKMNLGYSIMMLNCHGDLNIGTSMRAGEIFGAESVYVVGERIKYDARSDVGANNYINVVKMKKLPNRFFELNNLFPVFIEQGGDYHRDVKFFKEDRHVCFIFGSECDGIPKELMDLYPDSPVLTMNQVGHMTSLNVSTTAGIVVENYYHAVRCGIIGKYDLETPKIRYF